MGKRAEPRKAVQVAVRIFGTDQHGRIFSESVTTVDISRSGAKLTGVKAMIRVDEIVGLSCGKNKAHLRVKWIGQPGSPEEGQVGLLNLTPERPLWEFDLPSAAPDPLVPELRRERRKTPRVRCDVPVQLLPAGQPNLWGNATDLSLGGCFVEMAIPLKLDVKFEICLWLGSTKLRLTGQVVSTAPGFGIGVRFLTVTPEQQRVLAKHIDAVAHALA